MSLATDETFALGTALVDCGVFVQTAGVLAFVTRGGVTAGLIKAVGSTFTVTFFPTFIFSISDSAARTGSAVHKRQVRNTKQPATRLGVKFIFIIVF